MPDHLPKDTVRNPIALICSVELELTPLVERLEERRSFQCGRRTAWIGQIGSVPCIALAGGMGKTNAAQATTALLERTAVSALIGFGVGGAYLRSRLQTGDLAIASAEVYGDEGVDAPTGWLSSEGIGIPLLQNGTQLHFNAFPVDAALTGLLAAVEGGRTARVGPFVTVSCCSGTRARGDTLAGRFEAICETMEGAAYAHVAALYSVPFAEVRGISNLVTDRDMSSWRLRDAAHAAAEAVSAGIGRYGDAPGADDTAGIDPTPPEEESFLI